MIELKQFHKKYGNNTIYHDCSAVFPSGTVSFLMGKNGCGKTTLFKCMAGLEDYDGEILFDGKPLDAVRDRCCVVWDDSPLYRDLSGMQNLILLAEDKKSRAQIAQLAQVYLKEKVLKRKVKTYSYGQRKKLMLALVDILEPDFLFMDEISNGLDVDMMDALAKHLLAMKAHATVVLTGHQFSFYEKVAELVFIKKGKALKQAEAAALAQGLEGIYHAEITES